MKIPNWSNQNHVEKAVIFYDGYNSDELVRHFHEMWLPRPLNRRLLTTYVVPYTIGRNFAHTLITAVCHLRYVETFEQPFILLIDSAAVLLRNPDLVNEKLMHDYLHWLVEEFVPLRWYLNPTAEIDTMLRILKGISDVKQYPTVDVRLFTTEPNIIEEGVDIFKRSLV